MAPTYDQLLAENQLLKSQLSERDGLVATLEAKIAWLTQRLFGTGNSEKIDRNQLMFELDEAKRQLAEQTQTVSYERVKPDPKPRESAAERFKNLPVDEVVEVIPEPVKADPDLYEPIGQESTFEVDIQPPRLFKREIRRIKFKHRINRALPPVLAPAPARPVDGSYASAGLVSWVVLSKYLDHLPLYRQEKMLSRWGADISRQVMADWVSRAAEWFQPIYNQMRMGILRSGYVQADETPVRFCDPDQKKGKTTHGYLWVIHSPGNDVVFDWRLSRRHAEASDILDGYKGILQTDGYEAYSALVKTTDGITHVGCWAHARRKFVESRHEDPKASALVLKLTGRLYAYEKLYRTEGLAGDQRVNLRKIQQTRTLKWLKVVMKIIQRRALPKSGLGKASAYSLSRWDQLCLYLDHGNVEIDNNLVENKIRPSAIGKRNWLFIGHPGAGQRTAILYSILLSCEIHGIDPTRYMRDILTRLPAMTNQDDLTPLLPSRWQPPVQEQPAQ